MLKFERQQKTVDLDENDVVTLAEAARMSGRSIPVIAGMLDRGSLDWYEYPPQIPGKSGQRFTSRRAVLALPKVRRLVAARAGKRK